MLMIVAGTKNGEILRGLPRLQVRAVLVLDRAEAADAGAADRAAARRVGLAEIDAGVRHRLDARGDAVVHELIHAARFLRRDVLVDVEAAAPRPPKRTGKAETSKRVIGPMPLSPARMASHALARAADGRDDPEPVTTTRRLLTPDP